MELFRKFSMVLVLQWSSEFDIKIDIFKLLTACPQLKSTSIWKSSTEKELHLKPGFTISGIFVFRILQGYLIHKIFRQGNRLLFWMIHRTFTEGMNAKSTASSSSASARLESHPIHWLPLGSLEQSQDVLAPHQYTQRNGIWLACIWRPMALWGNLPYLGWCLPSIGNALKLVCFMLLSRQDQLVNPDCNHKWNGGHRTRFCR